MTIEKVFVTVGTTKFDKLIEEVSKNEILDILDSLGCNVVQFQVGTGNLTRKKHKNILLKYDQYFENFDEIIDNSDLIISHAGAGTCLEVLTKQKALIVVINEDLMDNHQIELAEQLAKEGYLKCCTPRTLKNVLLEKKFTELKPYPKPNSKLFSQYLDNSMGFENKTH